MRSPDNQARRWQHRLETTDDEGMNRQARRDAARHTRQPSSPRGMPPVGHFLARMRIARRRDPRQRRRWV